MQEFLKAYTSKDAELLAKIDPAEFQKAIGILTEAYRNDRQIFIAGNGGSTGTVNHFSFDFEKNAVQDPSRRRFRIISLAANAAKIIGFGNDVAFEEIFSQQMYPLFNEKDVLILVSSSGTSPDLIQACRYAAKKNGSMPTPRRRRRRSSCRCMTTWRGRWRRRRPMRHIKRAWK